MTLQDSPSSCRQVGHRVLAGIHGAIRVSYARLAMDLGVFDRNGVLDEVVARLAEITNEAPAARGKDAPRASGHSPTTD